MHSSMLAGTSMFNTQFFILPNINDKLLLYLLSPKSTKYSLVSQPQTYYSFLAKSFQSHNIISLLLNMQGENVVIRQEIISKPQFFGEASINVEQPLKNQSETFAYFTYNIEGIDMHGPFSIRRRYKDFDLLRRKLTQRWVGIYIPPISGKRSQSNLLHILKKFQSNNEVSQLKYAENRKRFLRYFCKGIAIRPYLFYCDLFQTFLRGGYDYQASIQGCLEKEYSFILAEYENNFRTLVQLTASFDFAAALDVNENHLKQLKANQEKLLEIYEAILRNVHARAQFNEQLNVCMSKAIPQYQQKIFLNNVGKDRTKLIIANNEEFALKLNEYKAISSTSPQQLFLELVAYEIRESKAFIEAIQGRKEAQSRRNDLKEKIQSKQKEMANLANGGFSFRAMFKSGSKQLQVKEMEMKIEIMKNQYQCIEKMIVIMVANTNYEIEQYKLRRGRQYGELFRSVADKELAELAVYSQLLNIPKVEA